MKQFVTASTICVKGSMTDEQPFSLQQAFFLTK